RFAPRQNRNIPIQRASRPADVRQAESANRLVAVVIPAVRLGIRAPLNHSERKRGAWKGVPIRARSDECVHSVVRRLVGLRKRRNKNREKESKKNKKSAHDEPPRRGKYSPSA